MKKYILILMCVILIFNFSGCAITKENSLYSNKAAWAYLGIGENKQADLFLLGPTSFVGDKNNLNLDIHDEKLRKDYLGMLNMQKGIYEDSLRLYAPYYSQAGLLAYVYPKQSASKYFDLAYKDVKESFTYYMENYNQNRPIVIAGFSQGSDMALRLLKDVFKDKKYQKQLICAYLIGWRVTEKDLEKAPHLKPAQGADDVGVFVSFNSEDETINESMIIPKNMKTFSINPLNWKTDETIADKSLNKGACFVDFEGKIMKEIPNLCGAYIDPQRGALKAIGINKEEYPPGIEVLEKGIYHIYDFQFFYSNLKENVATRVNKFLLDE